MTADLYIRVSTDEQADKGYSQRSQEEVLMRYCSIKDIKVRKVIFEDCSAKSFNRPEWQKMLVDLKKKRGQSDLVLFTKWDRFSRNAGDAYQMINVLAALGVEPQAIEQPLDISIPENKLMLAIYLAQPEVENDRRALNTFFGMRRARKEGRWMGPAVTGYTNKINEKGQKSICPKDPDASIMRWVFEQLHAEKINKARELLISGDLDSIDYRKIKSDSERQISVLEGKLMDLSANSFRIGPLLQKALSNVAHLPILYQNADIQDKRKIISSMFPENLTFDGAQHRTTRINEAIRVFNTLKADFGAKNKGKPVIKTDLPTVVAGSRIELPTLGL